MNSDYNKGKMDGFQEASDVFEQVSRTLEDAGKLLEPSQIVTLFLTMKESFLARVRDFERNVNC